MGEDNDSDVTKPLNALQENIRSKGKNSYYFAHEKSRETVFNYGGDPQLVKSAAVETVTVKKKHRIPKYSWADGTKSVKIYIPTEFCGEHDVTDDNVKIDWTDKSVTICVNGIGGKDYELAFPTLHDEIRKVNHKRKDDSLVLTLWKVSEISWYKLGAK